MRKICLLFILCCTASIFTLAQDGKKWPSSLLWRISGNGLTEPSYLYGTMHLQQKELFHFGDSLYHALNNVQGFAMEINPYEMVEAYLGKLLSDENFTKGDEEDEIQSREKKTQKKAAIRPRLKTRFNPLERKDDMSTIVDMYLYEKARLAEKWTGGLEDVEDQLHELLDELGRNYKENDVTPGDAFSEQKMLDTMVKWYTTQNLEKINQFLLPAGLDGATFVKRNLKMAFRADSLSHIRSMFFAVGAAHLPGDSGVISLLRLRGFRVDPVFSSRKIKPEPLLTKTENWVPVWEADSSHVYRMPSLPKNYNLASYNIPMKISLDLNEMVAYLFFSVAQKEPAVALAEDYLITRMIESYKKRGTPVTQASRERYRGYPALTGNIAGKGYQTRIRIVEDGSTIYVLLAGTDNGLEKREKSIQFFLNSLDIKRKTKAPETTAWTVFTDSAAGFTVNCPCTLKLKKEKIKDITKSRFNSLCYDNYHQKQYGVAVLKMNPGYYNNSDSSYFTEYKNSLAALAEKDDLTMNTVIIDGYPAAEIRFTGPSEVKFRFNAIVRGGFIYIVLLAGGQTDTISDQRFFRSFRLIDVKSDRWQWQTHPEGNLNVYSPGPFIKKTTQKEDADEQETAANDTSASNDYIVFDTETATSYFIFKTLNSPYQWFSHDSAWFSAIVRDQASAGDSIISKKLYYQQGLPVVEMVKTCKMQNTVRQLKFMITGDTLYEIQSYITRQQLASITHRKLYDSLVVNNPVPANLFTNKAGKLLHALADEDSAQRALATEDLEKVLFTKNELPLLHDAMIKKYPGDSQRRGYGTVGHTLAGIVRDLADSSTQRFIEAHYKKVPVDAAVNQSDLLYILAEMKTTAATQLLKKLLLEQSPAEHGNFSFTGAYSDTLQLAAQLFPEMTRLISDSISGFATVFLLDQLTDSNLVPLSFIAQAEPSINGLAATSLAEYKKDKDAYIGNINNLLHLLAKIKTPASLKLFNEFGKLKSDFICFNVLETSLKNQFPVSAGLLQTLAESKYYRVDAYNLLREYGLEKRYPAVYATQKAMGEALLFNYVSEYHEMEPKKIQFVKELTASVKGKTYRFLVYKLMPLTDGDAEWYTAFSGPYELNAKKILPETDYSGEYIELESAFTPSGIQKKFKAYLEELEKME